MPADCTQQAFAAGQALLERLRLDGGADSLGVNLAVALGILIAEDCAGDDLRLPLALIHTIALASARMRRTTLIVNSCAGSA